VWIAIADLDHFKQVNDKFGHEAGDLVLKRFAQLMQANTRASNFCGRLGGEEFLMVLSQSDMRGASTAMGRLRQELEAETFDFAGTPLRVTASFGVAEFQGRKAPEFAELLRQADGHSMQRKRTAGIASSLRLKDDA
jgi:diguanylate cyclase (GGDEF)-like protein